MDEERAKSICSFANWVMQETIKEIGIVQTIVKFSNAEDLANNLRVIRQNKDPNKGHTLLFIESQFYL